MLHFLFYVTGISNVSGRWYSFWSGFGGDLTIFAGVGVFVRHHNCHRKGCWRLGHPLNGRVVCHHHHPDAESAA